MVLDTRTLSSLHNLAAVVQDYTTPSAAPTRGSPELTRQQENQACRLRAEIGWHARHIAEAMGLATGANTWRWEANILDALEGCRYRNGWGSRPNQRLTLAQATVAGTNRQGAFRKTAKENAIVEAVLARGQIGTPDIPGVGQRARQIGQTAIKAGINKTTTELAAAANRLVVIHQNAGHYPGRTFPTFSALDVRRQLGQKDADTGYSLSELLGWVGGPEQHIKEWSEEDREKIDAEIIRRCVEQAKLTPGSPPYGFFTRVQTEIYNDFPCCGLNGQETMEEFGYNTFQEGHANNICLEKTEEHPEGIFKPGPTLQEQIDDPVNQQKVKDAIASFGVHIRNIMKETGLNQKIVEGIVAALGHMSQSARLAAIRAIILPLHDVLKLTATQMIDQTPELDTLIPTSWPRLRRAQNIRSLLIRGTPSRIPWTTARLRSERRIPLIAANIKGQVIAYLRAKAQDEEWVTRQRVGTRLNPNFAEGWGLGIDDLAAALPGRETPEDTQAALDIVASETPQLIRLNQQGNLEIPHSGLLWILRGGGTLPGEGEK